MVNQIGKKIIIYACLPFLLSACMMGADYKQPELNIAGEWESIKRNEDIPITIEDAIDLSKPWWEQFNDPKLSLLITESIEYNNDIKIAKARILASMAGKKAATAALLPQINAAGDLSRAKLSGSSGNRMENSSKIGVAGSLELDIFGKNRRQRQAEIANIESTQAEKDLVTLNIIAEVSKSYIRMRRSQKQKELTMRNIAVQKDTLESIKMQKEAGTVGNLDVARAEVQFESTSANLPSINTLGVTSINRLKVLTGEDSDTLWNMLLEPAKMPTIPDIIVALTPIQAIENRPDVKAAEMELIGSVALTGVAKAKRYPNLTIEGFFASQESKVFNGSNPWDISANMLFPLLNFGLLKADVETADARQKEAHIHYTQTVLLAIEEVENAFTAYMNEKKRYKTLKSVFEKQQNITQMIKEQYMAGMSAQLDLLIALQSQLDAENDYVLSEATLAENAIDLFRALGYLPREKNIDVTAAPSEHIKEYQANN